MATIPLALAVALTSITASPSPGHALQGPFPAPPQEEHYSAQRPAEVAIGDYNRDGIPDLALSGRGNEFGPSETAIHWGTTGSFQPKQVMFWVGELTWVTQADLRHTGYPDVLVGAPTGCGVFNNLGGAFAPAQFLTNINSGARVMLGDCNEDSWHDALWRAPFGGEAMLNLGDGTGAFGAAQPFATGIGTAHVVGFTDLSGDAHIDAVFANAGKVSRRLGDGLGGFAAAVVSTSTATQSGASALHDLDLDGDLDVLLATSFVDITIFQNDGAGALAAQPPINMGASIAGVGAGDVDSDQWPDLLASCISPTATSDSINTRIAIPGGGYGAVQSAGLLIPQPGQIIGIGSLATADLEGDGRVDVAVPSYWRSSVFVLRNGTPYQTGITPYGASIAGCHGYHGLNTMGAPQVGNSNFGFVATNAPPNSLGLLLVSDVPDGFGTDIFGIGLPIYVAVFGATQLYGFDVYVDNSGYGRAPAPLPPIPALAGQVFYAQSIFGWTGACLPSTFGLSTSLALIVPIVP